MSVFGVFCAILALVLSLTDDNVISAFNSDVFFFLMLYKPPLLAKFFKVKDALFCVN
jgi:hypothetical protein